MKIKLKAMFPKNYRVSANLYSPIDRTKKVDAYSLVGTLIDCYLQDTSGELLNDDGRLFIIWNIWLPKTSSDELVHEMKIEDKLVINNGTYIISSLEKQFNTNIEDHYKIGLKLANK